MRHKNRELQLSKEVKEELKYIVNEALKEELLLLKGNSNNKLNDQQLLSRKEISEYLHCSLTTLYNQDYNGLLLSYKGTKNFF